MFIFTYCFSAGISNQYAGKMEFPNAFWHIVLHERCKRFGVSGLITQNYVLRDRPFE